MQKLEERILQVLHDSQVPLGVSEIGKKIGVEKSVAHYHLKKLVNRGTIEPKDGKYKLSDISGLIEKITDLLVEKDCNFFELQNLGFDKHQLSDALYLLERKEWVYKIYPEGFITNENLEIRYALKPYAYSDLGLCSVCRKEIHPSEKVIVGIRQTQQHEGKTAFIHVECHPRYESFLEEHGEEIYCVYCDCCNLPISPRMLLRQGIYYYDIDDSFYKIELNTIDFLKNLHNTLNPLGERGLEDWEKYNDNIKEFYTKYSKLPCYNVGEIPEWILESIRTEEQFKERYARLLSNRNKINNADKLNEWQSEYKMISEERLKDKQPPAFKIFKELDTILDADLSLLQNAEIFVNGMMKYHHKLPDGYDIKLRIKEIWSTARNLKLMHENEILKMYEKLLFPSGFVFTYMKPTWAFDEQQEKQWIQYDLSFRRTTRLNSYQTIVFKHGDKLYHPFCAEKLGLKDNSYCNNKSTRGGENSEQKIRNDK